MEIGFRVKIDSESKTFGFAEGEREPVEKCSEGTPLLDLFNEITSPRLLPFFYDYHPLSLF